MDEFGVLTLDSGGSYVYDELFHDYIRGRLRARGEAAVRRAAMAGADARLRDGRLAEPLAICTELADWAAVGGLLSTHGFELVECGEADTGRAHLTGFRMTCWSNFPARSR